MNFFKKKKQISLVNKFSYEAHSSDYQSLDSLKKLINNNFKFLKVGPELTYYYMRAVMMIEKIEKNNYLRNLSNIKNIISKEMDNNKKDWNNYYFGSSNTVEFLKFNSYLDRSRYYWSKKNVKKSLLKLKKNINLIDKSIIFDNLSIFKNKFKLKNKLNLNNFDFIIYCYLNGSFEKYYKACKFSLK